MLFYGFQYFRFVSIRIMPDPFQETEINFFRVARRQSRMGLSGEMCILKSYFQDILQANILRDVQKNNPICTRHAQVEGIEITPVYNPVFSGTDVRDALLKRRCFRFLPAGLPVKCIEVVERKAGFCGQFSGKCRFAGTTGARDQDAIHRVLHRLIKFSIQVCVSLRSASSVYQNAPRNTRSTLTKSILAVLAVKLNGSMPPPFAKR